MRRTGDEMSNAGTTVMSKAEFMRLTGIRPELAEFVAGFIEKPETFFALSFEKRIEIENQMDSILTSFGQ